MVIEQHYSSKTLAALLDCSTIRAHKGRIEGLKVAICGDVLHSRVARSNVHLLTAMGAHVRFAGPRTLRPGAAPKYEIFAQGWLQVQEIWGRPVYTKQMKDGSLLIADDYAGAIYRISYQR